MSSPHSRNFSFGYLHGFSSSSPELSPLIEDVADYFAAPTYFVRLTGHGLSDHGESLAKAQCLDWLKDADRVVEQARNKGRDLIMIGMSFGGQLATFAALEHPEDVKALILISPFFELQNPVSRFVSGPLGAFFAKLILGDYHEFKPRNEMNARYWTTRYSTRVIPQFMNCTNMMRSRDLSKLKIPVLVLYTEKDEVVSAAAIVSRFQDIGSAKKFLVEVPGATNHVLTGNIMNPETLPFVEKQIEDFLEKL